MSESPSIIVYYNVSTQTPLSFEHTFHDSELGHSRVHVGGQDSLLISQTQDGCSQSELANLSPDELSVFRVDDA